MVTRLLIGIMLILPFVKQATTWTCSCYEIHEEGLTWTEARKDCQYRGKELAGFSEFRGSWRYLKSKVLPYRLNKFNNIWHIGLRRGSSGNWTWVNGFYIEPTKLTRYWQPGQPHPNANFAAMAMADCPRGSFIGVTNDTIAGFICEGITYCGNWLCAPSLPELSTRTPSNAPSQPSATTSTATSATSDTCQCYDIHEEGLTWTEARKVCQSRGGDLAYLSEPHWRILKSDILPNRLNRFNDDWHIGLWRNSSGNWTWVNGNSSGYWTWVNGSCPMANLTSYWQPGHPYPNATIAAMAMADCPRGNFKGVMNDTIAGFICQGRDFCLSGTVLCSPCAPEHTPSKPSETTPTVTSGISSSGNYHWTVGVIPLTCVIVQFCSVSLPSLFDS